MLARYRRNWCSVPCVCYNLPADSFCLIEFLPVCEQVEHITIQLLLSRCLLNPTRSFCSKATWFRCTPEISWCSQLWPWSWISSPLALSPSVWLFSNTLDLKRYIIPTLWRPSLPFTSCNKRLAGWRTQPDLCNAVAIGLWSHHCNSQHHSYNYLLLKLKPQSWKLRGVFSCCFGVGWWFFGWLFLRRKNILLLLPSPTPPVLSCPKRKH